MGAGWSWKYAPGRMNRTKRATFKTPFTSKDWEAGVAAFRREDRDGQV